MSRLRSVGFTLAALGLVTSALVHVASFVADVPMRSIWPLHVGVIALAVPLVATAQARRRGRLFGPGTRELLEHAPPWGTRILQLVFLNFLGHFAALIFAASKLGHGGAAPPGYEARMFSAGWMTAYLFFALAWWKRSPSTRPTR